MKIRDIQTALESIDIFFFQPGLCHGPAECAYNTTILLITCEQDTPPHLLPHQCL